MGKFILFVYDDPSGWSNLSPQQMQQIVQEYSAWAQRLAAEGKLAKGGQKLCDDGGRVFRRASGKVTVTDGPYTETKEVLGGFFLLEAGSYDEAAAIAQTCPHVKYDYGVRMDLRQVDEMH